MAWADAVDLLDTIPGVGRTAAEQIIAERLAGKRRGMEQNQEALAMEAGDRVHFVEQASALQAVGLKIARVHASQIGRRSVMVMVGTSSMVPQ